MFVTDLQKSLLIFNCCSFHAGIKKILAVLGAWKYDRGPRQKALCFLKTISLASH